MLARLRHLLATLTRRRTFESEIDTEFRFHMEEYISALVRSGTTREEALRRARVEFGSVDAAKEECREARGVRWFDELGQDLRYAWRTMRHSPGFASAAIVSLALGIGVNTAIFSLIDAVILRSLPVGSPQQLYFIGHGRSAGGDRIHMSSNYPLFEAYRSRADDFSGVAASITSEYKMDAGAGAEIVKGELATGNYHSVLQAPFAIGRGFDNDDDRTYNPVAVISHRLWTSRFANDPGVIGRSVQLNGHVVTILGVTAPGFFGVYPGRPADITLSMSLAPKLRRPDFFNAFDSWTNLTLVGRAKPGVVRKQAEMSADRTFQQFVTEPPSDWIRKMAAADFEAARLEPAAKGLNDLRRRFSEPLWVLFAIVLLVLGVACANSSSLLLARAGTRQKEIAVRLSLGVSRLRLLKQLLTESVLLSVLGGAVGALLAFWCTDALARFFAVGRNPVELEVSPNLRVLGFTAAVAVLCGILFGLAPAVRALKVDCNSALKGIAASGSSFRAGKIIVAAQVAICVLLLTAAGLLTRTLAKIQSSDVGFQRENILLANLNAHGSGLKPEESAAAFNEVVRRVLTLPGVRSASISDTTPLSTSGNQRIIRVPGRGVATPQNSASWNVLVSPSFFGTYGIELLRGRTFAASDVVNRPLVAVMNQAAREKFFPSVDPVGKQFFFGTNQSPVEIVGVVKNAAQIDPRRTATEIVYTPLAQFDEPVSSVVLAIRAAAAPASLVSTMRSEIRAASRNIAIQYVRTMPDQVNALLLNENLLATLSSFFAILAAALACVGLYGVMAYTVARRTREMGVRVAMGATIASVRWLVIRQAMMVVIAGLAIGLPAALIASRWLEGFLYRVTPSDPLTYTAVAMTLAVAALIAAYFPARTASRINLTQALRID
jgi:predicted permease